MSLKQRVVSNVGWSVVVKMGFQVITWVMTLLVIRILSPNDYGLMAISQVFANLILGFANFGLGDALVQREDTSPHVMASVFGALLLLSAMLTAMLALAAYPIASWYGDARLAPLIQVSSLAILINGLTVLPRARLTKSLRVRQMVIIELSSGLIGALVVVALAYAGHGVWALLLGWLAGIVVRLIGYATLTSEYYVWPRLDIPAIRPLFGYGIYRTLESTAWMVLTSADVVIVGRLLGPVQLGFYVVALNFAGMPLNKMAPIINSVAFPAFALVQGRPAEARFYALKALRMMALLAVPVFFGISATAPEIVDIVFGPKWAGARPLLAALSLAITFRAVLIVIPNYLQGIGDARGGFWCTAAGALILPPAILVGCLFGVQGACYAWLACYPVVFVISAAIAARSGGLTTREILSAPLYPMLAGAVMMLGVFAVRSVLPDGLLSEPARLACLVAAGAAVYGAAMGLGAPRMVGEFVQLRRSRSTSPA